MVRVRVGVRVRKRVTGLANCYTLFKYWKAMEKCPGGVQGRGNVLHSAALFRHNGSALAVLYTLNNTDRIGAFFVEIKYAYISQNIDVHNSQRHDATLQF